MINAHVKCVRCGQSFRSHVAPPFGLRCPNGDQGFKAEPNTPVNLPPAPRRGW